MTAESLCRHITTFGVALLRAGYVIDLQPHVVRRHSLNERTLSWARDEDMSLMNPVPSRLEDYLSLLERRDFSFLMCDGAILQISYAYDGEAIRKHRLFYHPCPFDIKKGTLDSFDGGILDYISENLLNDLEGNFLFRAPIRFDYAPLAAASMHPASHVTIADPDCRIPVRAPLQFDTFMRFVLENFYTNVGTDGSIFSLLRKSSEKGCISESDKSRVHMNW